MEHDAFDISKFLLFALLAQVREYYNVSVDHEDQSKLPNELVQLNQLLDKHAKEWNAIEDFATALRVTSARLTNICKEHFGKTALQLLHERKLLAAKRMLVYTEKQVKEVAYDCGFEDPSHFIKVFKKHENLTPLAYRNAVTT